MQADQPSTSIEKELKDYLGQLGLDATIAVIYLTLRDYGPQNILQLSHNSGIERTRLYRLLDDMTTYKLIETRTEYKKNIISAAPLSNLQILLAEREQKLTEQQEHLRALVSVITPTSIESPTTRIQMYRGQDGLKQMFWNQSRAQTETLAIMYENMQGRTGLKFFERWVEKCNELDLHFRGIISQNFIESQQMWYKTHHNARLQNWEARYVTDTVFTIDHSMLVYNNVVSYYSWHNGEVFGFEIYNQQIADSQRTFFEALWDTSTPVNDLTGVE